MLKIALFGSSGQLGRRLASDLTGLGVVLAPLRPQLDATNLKSVSQWLTTHQPDLIVNAIAMTAVDRAEHAPALAQQVNQHFVQQLADYAAAQQVWLLHFSTDYVFDGTGEAPWRETDPCRPLQQYGLSKRAGELAIIASGCPYLILRTSWLYDTQGHNFLLTMLQIAKQSAPQPDYLQAAAAPLQIVSDQIGAPTYARVLSAQVAVMLAQIVSLPPAQVTDYSGIYHLCASGACSWSEFAKAIFNKACALQLLTMPPEVVAISSSQLTRAAVRPKNSRLDTGKTRTMFGLESPHWQQQLDQCLRDLKIIAETGKQSIS